MGASRMKMARGRTAPGTEAPEAKFLEQALAAAGDGAFAVGPEGRVFLWNRAAERILGWTAREVVEKPCCDVLKGVDRDGNRLCYQGCHVMSLVRQGEAVQHFEMETQTKAGKPVWLDISILDVPSVDGGRAMTVHLFRDVTSTQNLLQLVRESLTPAPSPNGNDPSPLTRREVEILRLMASGANTKTLAERLHVSPATIRNHAQNIFTKLNVHSRLEAVAWANQHRLT
jgi:PAS domain S-box-containing protein